MFALVDDTKHAGRMRANCGPTAAGLLTGVPLSRIEASIRRKRRGGHRSASGRRLAIRGTWPGEIIRVLKLFGCKVERRPLPLKMSLREFAHDVEHMGTFFVQVRHHFIALEGGVAYDQGHLEGIPVAQMRRRRVEAAWHVRAPAEPKYTSGDIAGSPRTATRVPGEITRVRHERIIKRIAKWEARMRRAESTLKKLRRQSREYERRRARQTPVEPAPAVEVQP